VDLDFQYNCKRLSNPSIHTLRDMPSYSPNELVSEVLERRDREGEKKTYLKNVESSSHVSSGELEECLSSILCDLTAVHQSGVLSGSCGGAGRRAG